MKMENPWFASSVAATACAAIGVIVCAGCGEPGGKRQESSHARTEDMSWGPIRLVMTVEPAAVRYTEDAVLTLEISHPSEVELSIPPLDDRLSGFRLSGSYDEDSPASDGQKSFRRRIRLTPVVADEHRIAPFAVRWEDRGVSPRRSGWFPTRPIELKVEAPPGGGDIRLKLKPRWIAPPLRSIALAAVVVSGALLLGFALWRLGRRLHREAVLRRMSPRELALNEILALLAKDLLAGNRAKEFYIELTMIVRRYIELQHGVRAPEQTTGEFLAAVRDDPRFPSLVVAKLRAFLEAADLVKFAAHHPPPGAGDAATRTAREYIESDSADSPDGSRKKGDG
jgi:hypothetical protein